MKPASHPPANATRKAEGNARVNKEGDNEDDEEEEEDYMTMTFSDTPTSTAAASSWSGGHHHHHHETSLQRRRREQREGELRGRVKSKAELAAEEAAGREAALARSLLAAPEARKSKGLAMMARMGFTPGGALGAAAAATTTAAASAAPAGAAGAGAGKGDNNDAAAAASGASSSSTGTSGGAATEPIRIAIKEGRGGIGADAEKKRKVREAAEAAGERVKRARADEGAFRERVRREREVARLERLVGAAQKVAERMEEEEEEKKKKRGRELRSDVGDAGEGGGEERDRPPSSRPLKSVNVLWRGLVRSREEAERDRRMRHDLEQSLSRLLSYQDDLEDDDDRTALGRTGAAYVAADDLDDEDPELDGFDALEADEKLRRLVDFLRREHRYCFWCKFTYPDAAMDGCPGVTEEDHD